MSTATRDRIVGRLALEDGLVFRGWAFGACSKPATTTGEVVFNTAMAGYQEALTDPSYSGQILTMTVPMVGNYGIAIEDVESSKPQVAGFVIRELSRVISNYRAVADLSSWLARAGIIGIEGIDTRALVRHLRTRGSLRGAISCDAAKSDDELVAIARSSPEMSGANLVTEVSPQDEAGWSEDLGRWTHGTYRNPSRRFKVVALDCGAKRNIYRHLTSRGCEVHIVPHDTPAEKILEMKPDGIFISNGPGDPAAVQDTIRTLKRIAGELPTFGICLGHQLLALALGAKTYKLKFGHRGANQPVRNVLTGRVEITSQNHGFCVDPKTLEGLGCEVTHLHMNDGTVAGFRHTRKPLLCVQYHPEASPGPHDSAYLFDCFVRMMETGGPITGEEMAAVQQNAESTSVSPTVGGRI